MKVLTVIGNRPQFIKAAAVSPLLRASTDRSETARDASEPPRDEPPRDEEVMVHTGQHFDDELSAIFFTELGLASPERELGIALGSNADQTARMLGALEPVLADVAPDVVLVYGDTNSTLAGALAGAQAGVPVAHVEAGMRSFDRSMPEELNRTLTDHASSLLLCSSERAVLNLRREAVGAPIELVGDVMVDVGLAVQPRARVRTDLVAARGLQAGGYVLATAHRTGNVDVASRLERLVELLLSLPSAVLLPLHPRTRSRLAAAGLLERLERSERVVLTPPLGYVELAALLCNASAVLTDSGGLQKEAYLAGVRCVTLRPSTEWTETVEQGWNVLVDLDPRAALLALERPAPAARPTLYGDGHAGERVLGALRLHFG
ncbi:MAG: non-hydrolyzing UDP-N-acetylglucosamine 2-epimerase [Solirubrobacteraceae bacterium]